LAVFRKKILSFLPLTIFLYFDALAHTLLHVYRVYYCNVVLDRARKTIDANMLKLKFKKR